MAFVAYELFFLGERAAIIVHDTTEQEIDLAMPPQPDWMDADDAERLVRQIGYIVQANEDRTIAIREPDDPDFELRRGTPFEAESLSTATYAIANDSGETKLFTAFTIEFRPNLRSPKTFPVAVFAFDPRAGRLVSHVYGPENPHAPRDYNRRQQKLVGRHLDNIFRQIAMARMGGQVVSPFKNMGPQFRSEGLPSICHLYTSDAADE